MGWSCCVLSPRGDVWLEQRSADGEQWLGRGPGGTVTGSVARVVAGCPPTGSDPTWIDAVIAAISREIRVGTRRSTLLVKRGSGCMFHASRSVNRDSIARHGLDWRRTAAPGIAGDPNPEWPGVFLPRAAAETRTG